MRIEHLAIWVKDLEQMKFFYETYFGGKSNKKYHNTAKKFQSYFITFSTNCRLELMHCPTIEHITDYGKKLGLTHFAFSVGSKEKVNSLTERLRKDGFTVLSEPRITGDGYYESLILNPENNNIEIVA